MARAPGRACPVAPADRLACVAAADRLEQVYRQEATQIRAALAARLGDVGLAEELVHDAFVEALEHWDAEGVPPNPAGWLATTARRKAIDRLRRDRAGRDKLELLAVTESRQRGDGAQGSAGPADLSAETDHEAENDLLSLIFACCHPALRRDAQIALTLRVVCGLTTAEIAAAFLTGETAMARRLARSRKALRDTGADVRVPDPDELADRLDEVLAVIYLVFNEGYLASAGRTPARRDLATQAVALNRLLLRLMPREPEVLGLLALLLLHESRAASRFDGWGRLVRLQDQDRTRWDHAVAAEAAQLLSRAIELHRPGPYQVQAAIAAVHAQAPGYAQTDWERIRLLYDSLELFLPSPVVRLNRAVATRYAIGAQAALDEIEPLAGDLDGYRLFHAVRAELLGELGRQDQARSANERALALAANPAERELLTRRLSL
jgi:RNA polymerase sigma factor (sigma-70 family)